MEVWSVIRCLCRSCFITLNYIRPIASEAEPNYIEPLESGFPFVRSRDDALVRFSILFQSTFSAHNLPLVSPIQPYTIPDWVIYRPVTIIAYFVKSIHLSSYYRLNTPPSLVIAI